MKSLNDLVCHHLIDHLHFSRHGEGHGSEDSMAKGTVTVFSGAVMAVVNYVLYSIALAVLARHVYSAHTFGDFSAAVAAVTVGATAGTLGLEKYLLKLIPDYRARGELGLLRGFRRFAPFAAMGVTLCVAVVLLLVWALSQQGSALHHTSLLIGILVLPLVVLVSYFLEVATADGAYILSTFVYRVVFPGLVLAGVFILDQIYAPIVAEHAVMMWGICWAIVLVIMVLIVIFSVPRPERSGDRVFQRVQWLRHSSAFVSYSLLMSLMANAGVLVLGFVAEQKQQTAIYAVAAQLGALFVVISTAVNRWFGPQIATLLATHDADRGQRLVRMRRPFMWGLAILYVCVIVFLGKPMLSLFGPEYVAGYVPLLIISAGTVVTAVNSLSPIYIQYVGREWTVPIMLGLGVGMTFILTVPLAYFWNATGAAIGYSVSGASLFFAFSIYARRIRRRRLLAMGREDLAAKI